MHQLTIDHDHQPVSVTDHPDYSAAHRALLRYVVGADYYLQLLQHSAAHTTYRLLRPTDPDHPIPTRRPQAAGTATITTIPDPTLPVSAPHFTAHDAHRWITEHATKWLHGSPGDPGHHYPVAVLTMARGEAHYYLRAGTVLPEAAHLAGADDLTVADRSLLETVRHNAVAAAAAPDDPAATAAAVVGLLPAATSAQQTAALIWDYTLPRWGASAL